MKRGSYERAFERLRKENMGRNGSGAEEIIKMVEADPEAMSAEPVKKWIGKYTR